MRRIKRVIATTHVDAHGDILQKNELEHMAAEMARGYILIGYGHDPRHPPIGRVVSTNLVKQDDGEYTLEGICEIWDKNDKTCNLTGDGRKVKSDGYDYKKPTILYNHFDQYLVSEISSEIAKAGFDLKDNFIQKAYEPISVIIICGFATLYVHKAISAFIDGFFSELGKETNIKLLKKLFSRPQSGERLVVLNNPFSYDSKRRRLEVILEKESDVDELSKCDSKKVEVLVESALASEPRTLKVVIGWAEGEPRILYSVRDDGIPSVIMPIPDDELNSGDLSTEGTARRIPKREE